MKVQSIRFLLICSLFLLPIPKVFSKQPTGNILNHCLNLMKDADETGVDCGGRDCKPCSTPTSQHFYPTMQRNAHLYACKPEAKKSPPGGQESMEPKEQPCEKNPDGTITVISTHEGSEGIGFPASSPCALDGKIWQPECDKNVLSYSQKTCDPGLVCQNGQCVPQAGQGVCGEGGDPFNNTTNGSDSISVGGDGDWTTLTVTTSDGHMQTFSGQDSCGIDCGPDNRGPCQEYAVPVVCDQNENHLSYSKVFCTNGTICIDGACKNPLNPTCTVNSDGTVSLTNDHGNDWKNYAFCVSEKTLAVPICKGNEGAFEERDCPKNQECSSGACVPKLPPCSKVNSSPNKRPGSWTK